MDMFSLLRTGRTGPNMSKLVIVIFSLFGLIYTSVAQGIIQEGLCDYLVDVVTQFNVTAYQGVWYDIESFPSSFQNGTCNTATYSLNSDATALNVQNTQINDGILSFEIGSATPQAGANGSAKFDVIIGGPNPVPYWVLDTDYETFALVYSCRNDTIHNTRTVSSWKLGRRKGPLPDEVNNRINNNIDRVEALKNASDKFVKRDHSEDACSYFVDIDGPCPTVTGVPGFQVDRFLGAWYEVARYPQTAQTGQCNRAVYGQGATDGVYTVENSQVTNEVRYTISGEARATDQSGVLAVTFNERVEELYVLATDYENYALLYSCATIEGNRRRIGSWQLRKNFDPLNEIATKDINDAIAKTPNLETALYQTTSQTSAACFYYPDFPENPDFIELPGECDTSITGVADFDVDSYLGTWYEVARYPQTAQTGQCSRAEYYEGATPGVYTVVNNEVTNETRSTISGEARATDQSGVLAVTFNIGGQPRTQNLHVLATDYKSYALVYSCENINGNRRVGSWKLSRSLEPFSEEATGNISAAINNTQGLKSDLYQETSQTSAACFYYPDFPDNPDFIELPGECDTSITGVADFDVKVYLGAWYEVARYPQTAQTGQCNRAQYAASATPGVYTVVNSQVTDETRSTISGEARATNQSGVLAVTFNIGGQPRTQNLHVLATDYKSYALVYSCENINGNRRVGSWKLSRSLEPFSEEATGNISAAINNTQGLKSDLYQETSQTSAACFYYPDFPENPDFIELPGECDTSITGVADFDVDSYLGAWYEVARYPQTAQTGQCNRAQYAASATTGVYTVVNSQVTDETRSTISGEARATNQSGVLAVTFNIGGQPRTQNLHVLATDYKSYALVYSCENINGNRRVGSWKLSRSLEPFSEEATGNISAAINNTQGLKSDLYQETSQTSAACFYYPDFPENPDFIELSGECDTSITGVADFDVDSYLGAWYEVARYPQTAQTGQCNRAQYAAGATTGVYTVVNSQVTDETRSTISGEARATNQSGVLAVTFNIGGQPRTQNLHVLATDYRSYALVYSCENINGNRRVGSWKLSRSLEPFSEEATGNINAAINKTQGLRPDLYQETSQTSAACFYYPDFPENPDFIELSGECDTSITGVADFDVDSYLGAWYEVARYPQTAQTGQCNRAQYAAGATTGVYTVVNSQVTDETRSTISGEARATNQSGVLAVTFNIGGQPRTQNLHVLATDYRSYALVYSCENINGNRRVGSWKLSRSLEPFSEEATGKINAAINKTQGLRPDLYQETSQTSAACFYYPDIPENPDFIELPGECDTSITGVADFDVDSYLGAWYEVARYPQTAQTGQCNRAQYAASATTGVYTVVNSQVTDETRSTISGEARATNQSGVLAVTFNIGGQPRTQNLHVLATDYKSYALVYSCENINGNRRVGSWKLSRSLEPFSEEATGNISAAINNTQGLKSDLYQETSQTSAACFYYPDFPENPDFIELSGECDTSITGVADFDVDSYLGAWYEVARYPQTAQTGQCNRAQYAAGATTGVYTVVNSQVTDETRSTISGEARATNQSGVLAVTFNIGGQPRTQNLHVLATDYRSYALVYSCENINGNRRVGSWKLSRSLEPFSEEATGNINAAINKTQGLRPDLYQETSQTSAACFYYPDFPENPDFIELSGECDTSITGVADFDVDSYLGAWYEVARYPQTAQTGQCNRAQYAAGATTGVYTVVNSQVTDETRSTISGEARATNQSGVLAVTFNIGGQPRTQNLHVLATDYRSYALVYSCENINGNRRVGSWKLSRSLEPFSEEATGKINAAINKTQGLRPDLYQETSQTSAACFYYPDIPENPDFIELPGECDTSITGVADFDVDSYLGAWYEVARYPQTAQTGQCNRAQYAAGATTGVYTVVNSQVTNETQSTISGEARATNQSGVLAVTFNIGGQPRTQNLHVLATDYKSYALVYSCENINGNRRVGSWKLSRSLEPFSEEATGNINAAINKTQGLRPDLYQETSQTSAACFHYPDFPENSDFIELPGECDTSITGVADFDVNSYLGAWYEVARYPQTAQTGQCNRAQYAAGATTGVYTVVNSQVTDETRSTISGEARATNQSGVLAVTFNIGGQPRTQNLHVLATDYESYALVYSCENINGNRRVGSWKLSRSLEPLSDAANNVINAAISNTQGLRPDLYQETQQSEDACWYYPPQNESLPVIIPGQCDTAISGVANIDLTKFANSSVWYQISRYDPVGERSCIGNRLTLAGDYINVNSIEVIGGQAKRTEGIARLSVNDTGKFDLELTDSDKVEIYVLATDYDNYAIAYTCKNESTTQRQIGVWLLSRTRNWPNAVNSTLETLINNRREITNRPGYFKDIPQSPQSDESETCPEPSSAFLFRSSIIVIFVCTILQLIW